MSDLLVFVRWEEYQRRPDGSPLLGADPITFSSAQARLHRVNPGERVWLVSRFPDNQQYYLVGFILVEDKDLNPPETIEAQRFGPYRVTGRRNTSVDLKRRCQVTDLLHALSFSPRNPIKPGASIGQSIQTIRQLSPDDVYFLETLVDKAVSAVASTEVYWNPVVGLWTKCRIEYARRFLENWQRQVTPQAFLLYDARPWVPQGAPVFIHADGRLTLVAKFSGSEIVSGYKPLYDESVRIAERERIWSAHRSRQRIPTEGGKDGFDRFWEAKNGVRSLMYISDICWLRRRPPWAEYGSRLLQWGMPTCVGYRYLTLTQCKALLQLSQSSIMFRSLLELLDR